MALPAQLNPTGSALLAQLLEAKSRTLAATVSGPHVHVAGVGKTLTTAYEQLRNAAEYAQEHLLRQRAIKRFYARTLFFNPEVRRTDITLGEDLIVELTQAGYVANDSIPTQYIDTINTSIATHYSIYWSLREHDAKKETALIWTLELLSVECERLIEPGFVLPLYAHFASIYYNPILQKVITDETGDVATFQAAVYVAVQRSLLKSDRANVRFDLAALYRINAHDLQSYIAFHSMLDITYEQSRTESFTRYINNNGAALRILKDLVESDDTLITTLPDKSKFLTAFEAQTTQDYLNASYRINRGIAKSIAFLLITKVLVGLAIEIPYDLFVSGAVIITPLAINLLFPIIYMAGLRFSLNMPSSANTTALREYIENALYGNDQISYATKQKTTRRGYGVGFNVAYGLLLVIIFVAVGNILARLGFNVVQGFIFFLFASSASFLGFRLSRIVRELEIIGSRINLISVVRDFLYMPFIVVGQWISDKYAKVNIVTLVLDTIIELPLKTIIRLFRQWTVFLSEKKDEL